MIGQMILKEKAVWLWLDTRSTVRRVSERYSRIQVSRNVYYLQFHLLKQFEGGPGESGVGFVIGQGQMMAQMSAGLYDIVSWDPRGVGETMYGSRQIFLSETS